MTLPDLKLTCVENEDGSFTIEWDADHPVAVESGMNDWTEQQWLDLLIDYAQTILDKADETAE